MLGTQEVCYGFGVKDVIEKNGIDFLFKNVKHIFENGDLVFGNLEAPISNNTNLDGFDAEFFLAKPEYINILKNSYINCISVANNHIMQHGEIAYLSTINLLNKYNILPVGVKNEIKIVEIKGLKIAIMGYSFIEDYINNSLYNKISSVTQITDDILKIRNSVDFIIISLHWGNEYIHEPSPSQIEIGRLLIDEGVDLILGSHAHVIQSYEIYKDKPIIYGLGNFIFDDTYIPETQKSVVFKIQVDLDTRHINTTFVPIISNSYDYCPKVAVDENRNSISQLLFDIKSMIENKSISEYTSLIGDYSTTSNKYRKKARMYTKYQFLQNIYKYPIKYTTKAIYLYLAKMLKC